MIRKALVAIAAAVTLSAGVFATTGAAEAGHRHSRVHVGIFVGNGFNGGFDDDFYDVGYRPVRCRTIVHRHHRHGVRHAHRVCRRVGYGHGHRRFYGHRQYRRHHIYGY